MDLSNESNYLKESAVRAQPFRLSAAHFLGRAAAGSLAGTIFLIPFRTRVILQTRPVPPVYGDYTNFLFFASDALLVLTLVFWALSLAFRPRRLRLSPYWLTLPLAGATAAAAISAIGSVDRALSLYQTGWLILLFGFYLYLINETPSLKLVLIAAGAQLAVQASIAVAQVLQQHSLGLAPLQELALDPSWNGVSIVWSNGLRSLRAYGLTDHPNVLGGCLALALILVAAAHLRVGPAWKALTASLAALGSAALLLSFSRSAWLGLAGGLLLIVAWLVSTKRWPELGQLAVLGAACFLLAAPFLWQNIHFLGSRLGEDGSFTAATPENQAINERVLLNQQALTLFLAHPMGGVGVGAFPEALHQANPGYPFNDQPPHLVALDVAAETGAVGGLAYLLIEILPWAAMLVLRRKIQFSLELIAVSGALLAVSLISLLDYYPWMLNPGRLWQWLLWGLWGSLLLRSLRAADQNLGSVEKFNGFQDL